METTTRLCDVEVTVSESGQVNNWPLDNPDLEELCEKVYSNYITVTINAKDEVLSYRFKS